MSFAANVRRVFGGVSHQRRAGSVSVRSRLSQEVSSEAVDGFIRVLQDMTLSLSRPGGERVTINAA